MSRESLPTPIPSIDPNEKPAFETKESSEIYPDHSDIKRNDIVNILKKKAQEDILYKELLDELTNTDTK